MSAKVPNQAQLLLPLLETLREMGGRPKADDAIEALSDRFSIPEEVRNDYRTVEFENWGSRRRCAWRQSVHWVRQTGVTRGLIGKNERGVWTLTSFGEDALVNCKPGVVLVVYETPNGEAFWADAITGAGALADNSVNLLFTSPPYPVLRGRGYGTFSESEVVELIVKCATQWKRALADDASVVLNLKDMWRAKSDSGGAVRSLYQEKILMALVEDVGLYFADRLFWRNPSCSPSSSWVTVQKVRCNQDVEQCLWLSKTPNPKADNRRVLVDAKPSTIETYLRRARRGMSGTKVGPSGQKNNFEEQMASVAAGEGLKVIPRNLLEISNADTHSALKKKLADANLPRHDAMMPVRLAEFFIKFLTDPNDVVLDPFLGSGTTAVAAEGLGRRWIGSDRSLAHLMGSALRFDAPQFEPKALELAS